MDKRQKPSLQFCPFLNAFKSDWDHETISRVNEFYFFVQLFLPIAVFFLHMLIISYFFGVLGIRFLLICRYQQIQLESRWCYNSGRVFTLAFAPSLLLPFVVASPSSISPMYPSPNIVGMVNPIAPKPGLLAPVFFRVFPLLF